jgi:2-polyprenyl-6-methoxyphenol hydroxylase-like FAD-dependent oxidoreductase
LRLWEDFAVAEQLERTCDVVIVGTGLAGLTLTRHLLLYTDKTVLLLDKRQNPPREAPQKYGESLVQCSGYYFSKVLDMEEYLLVNHYLKYNLRFYWPTEGLENQGVEDYSQSYVRLISNIPTFQLDRNLLEEHLLQTNQENPRCRFAGGIRNLEAKVSSTGDLHQLRFDGRSVRCRWLVDASGRGQVLKRSLGLARPNAIRHNATFCWVEGLVNVEKLTRRSHQEVLYDRSRQNTGHFPFFLSTTHFCAEGQWFWVIPLHHKTSLGLVYDSTVVNPEEVSNTSKMLGYVCRTWPLFARDLPRRKVLDEGRIIDFSYDCRQTISVQRWALVGEAGRFSDPLYSPGSDLISIYNTLIVDAIQTEDDRTLEKKCYLAEQIQRVMYEAYVPSYARSYNCLGDQEAFTLKYTWELAVYFGFYVFPMINNFYADPVFMPAFLRRFALLGPINSNLQSFLSDFFEWKKQQPKTGLSAPHFVEFFDMQPLREAEKMFYQVGLAASEAVEVIDCHLRRLEEFARYIIAHIYASVLGEPDALTNAAFISRLDLRHAVFNPQQMQAEYSRFPGRGELYHWGLDPWVLKHFIAQTRSSAPEALDERAAGVESSHPVPKGSVIRWETGPR